MRISLRKQAQRGTSLVEVVVATTILIIIVAGLFNCFGYGFFVTQLVRENQRATQIILEKVEIIRLYNWTQVNTPGFVPNTFTEVFDPQAPEGEQGVTYQGRLEVTDYPGSGADYSANIKQLVVTLTWTTGGKVPHTRTLATLIARDGEQNYVF